MKKVSQSEPITKNDLELLNNKLDRQFSKIDNRFEQVDKRFENVEKLINSLDKQQQMYLKIAKIDTQVVINQAIDRFEKKLSTFADKMFTRIDPLLQEIETNREHRIISTRDDNEIKARLDNLESRVQVFEKN